MMNLLKKDILLNKYPLLFFFLTPLILWVISGEKDLIFLFHFSLDVYIFFPVFYILRESRNGSAVLSCFPLKKRQILAGYFLSSWCFYFILVAANLLTVIFLLPSIVYGLKPVSYDACVSTFLWHTSIMTLNIMIFFPIILFFEFQKAFMIIVLLVNFVMQRLFYTSGQGSVKYFFIVLSVEIKETAKNFSIYMTSNFSESVYYIAFFLIILLLNILAFNVVKFFSDRKATALNF